jgi:hypothetical protein
MSDAERRMIEDRRLRDAALALVKADFAHLQHDLTTRSLGARFLDRISEGATDVFEEAVDVAENNRGVLATLLAAVLLWFARNPILALFERDEEEYDDGNAAEPEGACARSPSDT